MNIYPGPLVKIPLSTKLKSKSLKFGITLMLLFCVSAIITSVLTMKVSNMTLKSGLMAQEAEELIFELDEFLFQYRSLYTNTSDEVEFRKRVSKMAISLKEFAVKTEIGKDRIANIINLTGSLSKENLSLVIPKIESEIEKLKTAEVKLYRETIETWRSRSNFLNLSIVGLQAFTLILVAGAFLQHLSYLDQKRMAAEAIEELAKLVETTHECILAIDPEGKIKRWNSGSERTFGISETAALDRDFRDLAASAESREKLDDYISRKVNVSSEEIELRRSDDSFFNAAISLSPVLNERGEVKAITIIARDISEQVEQRREQADFIASITHDLKNPLIANNQVLKLIAENTFTEDKKEEALSKVINSNNDMIEIFSSMLEVYKINAGVLKSQLMAVDLPGLIVRQVDSFSHQAETKKIGLQYQVQSSEGEYYTDPLLVQKILSNLIDNAIKYSDANSSITVSTAENDEWVSISVSDQGKGISLEQKENLFRFTPKLSTEQNSGGSSVGLYLCHKLALELGGEIRYVPRVPRGSKFELVIPCKKVLGKEISEEITPESDISSTPV